MPLRGCARIRIDQSVSISYVSRYGRDKRLNKPKTTDSIGNLKQNLT